MSVEAGKWYELSTYYLGHRCNGIQPYVAFANAAGTVLTFSSPGIWSANQNTDPGRQLSNYQRNWFRTQAPAGSVYAYVFFRHKGTINGQNDSYLWIHKPFFGRQPPTRRNRRRGLLPASHSSRTATSSRDR